jgi:predicted phosphodiesterase
MNAQPRSLVVLSDVHLSHVGPTRPGQDVAAVVRKHEHSELVLAGDVFDLSVDPPSRQPADSVIELLKVQPELRAALREHLLAGAPVTLLAGNHDASVATSTVRTGVLDLLGLQPTAPLQTAPWFIRRGATHVEHGHFYDPDNAPAHPLALWSYATEPLGIALTRRFLAPCNALQFAHAHELTPLEGLLRAFRLYGARTPWVISQYFSTALKLCIEPRKNAFAEERLRGTEAIEGYAAAWGLDAGVVEQLVDEGASPTHQHFKNMFMRLYFDRIAAALTMSAGGLCVAAGASVTGIGVAALSAAYLAGSVKRGRSRYSGLPEQRLRDAAAAIRELSGAELVIFGHTHREEGEPGYMNSGSFVYSRRDARTYIFVDADGRAERCVLPLSA